MKRLIFTLVLAFGFSCALHAQVTTVLKHDSVSGWIGKNQVAFNVVTPVWNDVDSSVAFIRNGDGSVLSATYKYNKYGNDGSTPFPSYAALKAYVRQYFFVDASASAGSGGDINQGGNSFGTTMILGTTDNNNVSMRVNTAEIGRFTSAGLALATGLAFQNLASQNNASLTFTSGGAVFIRNVADNQSSLTVNQANGSSTGDLLTLQGNSATRARILNSGAVVCTQFRLSALNTAPASATDTGILGEIRFCADGIYICTATNTWIKCIGTTF